MNSAWAEFLHSVVGYFQSLGPGVTGYMLAILALGFTLFVLGYGARSYSRHMTSVVNMSAELRESMAKERAACLEECKRLREVNDLLIRQHSMAREEFLQEAREREMMVAKLLADNERTTIALRESQAAAAALHAELDAIRAGTRSQPRE